MYRFDNVQGLVLALNVSCIVEAASSDLGNYNTTGKTQSDYHPAVAFKWTTVVVYDWHFRAGTLGYSTHIRLWAEC